MSKGTPGVRYAEIDRETRETKIHLVLDLDGGNRSDVSTGIPFFDHMLHQMAFHGYLDFGVTVEGDLDIDDHHSVEDVGICLGQAIRKALMDSNGIARFGSAHGPMDDSLVLVALDFSGRGYLVYDVELIRESIGGLSLENVREFFQAVASHAGITLHIKKINGFNDHHTVEALFKAFGVAIHQAVQRTERKSPSSTKGII